MRASAAHGVGEVKSVAAGGTMRERGRQEGWQAGRQGDMRVAWRVLSQGLGGFFFLSVYGTMFGDAIAR